MALSPRKYRVEEEGICYGPWQLEVGTLADRPPGNTTDSDLYGMGYQKNNAYNGLELY
jgi:hypothetical protein